MRGALLAGGGIAALGAAAAAFSITSVNGKPWRWPSWTATIHTDPDMPANRALAIKKAAATWTSVDGASFRFVYGGDSPSADLTDLDNGNSDVYFAPLNPFVYAVTVTLAGGSDIREQDVVFNSTLDWSTTGLPADGADVESVALHELGHVLGLGHEDVLPSVMRSSGDASVPRRSLSPDDEAGVRYLYPSPGGGPGGEDHPDVEAESLAVLSGTPGPGAQVVLRARFANRSDFPCGSFPAAVTLSTTRPVSGRDEVLKTVEVAVLFGGESRSMDVSVQLPADLPPGTWRLGLLADPANSLGDAAPGNNVVAGDPFEVVRAPGSIVLGRPVDAPLGAFGTDGVDVWIGAGTRVVLRGRGIRGVRPALRLLAPGSEEVLAGDEGGASASLRWTAPADGTYRVEVANTGDAVGRVRIATSGSWSARAVEVEAPGALPFPGYEGGAAILEARGSAPVPPLSCRPPAGPDFATPITVRGDRARLGPLVLDGTGPHALLLAGEGPATCSVRSRTVRRGETLVR